MIGWILNTPSTSLIQIAILAARVFGFSAPELAAIDGWQFFMLETMLFAVTVIIWHMHHRMKKTMSVI